MNVSPRVRPRTRRTPVEFLRDTGGTAAVEIALWAVFILVPLANVSDLSIYAGRRMQVELAAQAAVAAAWKTCNAPGLLPAAKNCTNLLSNMTTAAQSTSLGSSVTIASGFPLDGYYCVNASSALTQVGTTAQIGGTPTKPATCTSVVAGSTTAPGEYLKVTTTYSFTTVFGAVSVAALLPSPITKTAWIRLA
jgi:Flp pilus assembly protein TadG